MYKNYTKMTCLALFMMGVTSIKGKSIEIGSEQFTMIGNAQHFEPLYLYPDYYARGLYIKICASSEEILNNIKVGTFDYFDK